MLNFKSFSNAKEFNDIFGLRECGNGNKARKNKILLGCLKDKAFFKMCAHNKRYEKYLSCTNMADFKKMLLEDLSDSSGDGYSHTDDRVYRWYLPFDGKSYRFCLRDMESDNNGFCYDGDSCAVRYYNHDRKKFFKMKAGKFFNRIMESCPFGRALPQQAKSWLGEEFKTSWQAYAEKYMPEHSYEFHYGDDEEDFEYIYSSENRRGDFTSCMTDKGYHDMYSNSAKCHAAWLTGEDGLMFARCIIWDEVYDRETDSYLRLAERQYSDGVQDKYKKMLVDELISRKLIDGYKQIGASCHDNTAFVLNNGKSISDHHLSIHLDVDWGDHVSYMDSFVYYDRINHVAYNYEDSSYSTELDTTDGFMEGDDRIHEYERYSEEHNEWIPEDEAYYVERHDDYYYSNEVVEVNDEWELEEDCVQCDQCGKWILEDDAYQADGLPDDLYFCDSECAEEWACNNGYTYSNHEEMYVSEDDCACVNIYHRFFSGKGYWDEDCITKYTFNCCREEMHELNGEWYWLDSDAAEEAYKNMTQPAPVVAA